MKNVSGDALAGEPFYRELRRRHGDIDIVVLAGHEPTATEPVDREVARRAAEESRADFDDVWLTAVGGPVEAVAAWRAGTVTGVIHTEVTGSTAAERARGEQMLRQGADSLAARSWAVHLHQDGVPRVVASRLGTTVRLVWWDDRVTLTLQGPGTSIGVEAMRDLMDEAGHD